MTVGSFPTLPTGSIPKGWCGRIGKLLDCRLPKSDIRRWAKRPDAADELVACGWWRDIGDAYVIVHHAVYQRTRDAVLAQQDANQKNGQRGGRPKGPPRERRPRKRSTKTHSLTESLTESKSESPTERDGTGLDRKATTRVGELPVAAGAEWPRWRGQGSSPFDEYN